MADKKELKQAQTVFNSVQSLDSDGWHYEKDEKK